ncbi:MAG: hypothetical protein HC795_07405 [Coleofasciculaceae cyanobacterium RL_1_1]|nr:hypothetical protein [Coleofasciculaceae cyanobacterium RL_1_1]
MQFIWGGEYRGGGTLPTAAFTVVDGGSVVDASAIGSGDGGEVIVWADDTAGFFGQIRARGGASGGNGGFVETSGGGVVGVSGWGWMWGADYGGLGSVLLDPTNITISSALSDPADLETINPFSILAADYDGQDVTINAAFLQAITGNVTLEATNDLTLATNLTFAPGGGAIVLMADSDQSGGGAILGSGQNITASGRNLTLTGHGITLGNLDTSVNTASATAGSINLDSTDTLTLGSLTTGSGGNGGRAGDITLDSEGELSLGGMDITSGDNGTSGAIAITGRGGLTSLSLFDEIFADSGTDGTAGTVSIDVDGDIAYTNIQGGRQISLTSDGSISLGLISADGATVSLITNTSGMSNHDITIRDSIITATSGEDLTSGNVSINSAGAIDLANGSIDTKSTGDRSTSGTVTLSAVDGITLRDGIFTSSFGQETQSGNINITQSNRLTLGTTLTTMSNGLNSIAGDVILRSNGDISFYELLSYGFGTDARSGEVSITSGGNLNVNNIQTQSGQTAGDVTINTTGDLMIADLLLAASSGVSGTGGNITLTSDGDIGVGRVFTTAISHAGDVSMTAGGTLTLNDGGTPGFINALSVTGAAGDVTLRASATDAASLGVGAIDAFSYNGAGGSGVNLQSVGDIRVGNIQTGASQGTTSGNIVVNSTQGNIAASQARSTINDLRPVSEIVGQFPSDPSLDAIKTTLQSLSADEQSGLASSAPASNITLSAPNGTIAATGNLDTYSESGAAGQVQITSGSGLTLQDVTSYGNTASGNLTITSTGAIATTDITTLASSGQSGNVLINGTSIASGNVSSIAGTGSGNITITATDGTVNTRNLSTTTTSGSSGNVTVSGTGNVTTGTITSSTDGDGDSGDITAESSGGSVTTGDVTTESSGGNSGNIDFSALIDIITGNLTSRAGQSSGDITLNAGRDINTGDITSAAVEGDSGDINLTAGRDITAGDITSSSENGQSGDIGLVAGGNITTGNITTEDGQISLNADGTIATGDLNSDNVAIINGEPLDSTLETDNFVTIATQQRDSAIADDSS